MKKYIFKVISAVVACVLICSSFASCSDPLKSTAEEKEIVMTVGDYEVPYELYRYMVLNYKSRMTSDESDRNDPEKAAESAAEIDAAIEEDLKDFYAVFALADENGVGTDNEAIQAAVDAAVKDTRNGYESDEAYVADLATGYLNHSVYELLTANSVCSEELFYALINKGKLNNDEEHLRRVVYGDEFIRVKQILVVGESSSKVSEGTVYIPEETHTDEEAAQIAEEAMKKAKAGEDFDSLVAEYGESFYMFGNKDGYYLCRGEWDAVNEDAVFALEIGQVSDVVKSDAGYSVFVRCEKEEGYMEAHYDELCEKYLNGQYSLMLSEASENLTVTKTEIGKALSVLDIKWEDDEE